MFLPHRLCTAPMMDWSDRHCRYFFRQLSSSALVYTEMITTGALIHGDIARHLDFNREEHPVALSWAAANQTTSQLAPGSARHGATTKST